MPRIGFNWRVSVFCGLICKALYLSGFYLFLIQVIEILLSMDSSLLCPFWFTYELY